MEYVWITFFITLLFTANGLNIFGMPGNWLMCVFVAIWVYIHPEGSMGWWMVGGLVAMAAVVEILEFIIQTWSAKKYGATGKGNWGGIIGAIVGAFIGAGLFLGLGAIPGALLGAYGGCLLIEMIGDRPFPEAAKAAKGAFFGKSLGLTLKLSVGMTMMLITTRQIWPS